MSKRLYTLMLSALTAFVIAAWAPAKQGKPRVLAPPVVAGLTPSDSLDLQTGLVVAPGYAAVKANCIRCHSPQLITAKRASRAGWEATIRWMQQTQGLPDLGQAEPIILDYLSRHYALTQEGRRPPLKDIRWYRLE